MPSELKIARASLHMWEEPCISGENGSGTVFFSGCSLRCVYCQNHRIAINGDGGKITENELAKIFLDLQSAGAHNINLVTPTHYADKIITALKTAKPKLKIPIVYNTGGYESVSTLKSLENYVDIYLTDFKYMSPETAKKYSNAPDYPSVAKAALDEMVRQKPKCTFDGNGIMKSGVIVRNLLLPGSLKNSKDVIEYVFSKYKDNVFLSIMNQYTPVAENEKFPELNFSSSGREYKKLIDFCLGLGIKNAYLQDGESASKDFVPTFGKDRVLLDF